MMTIRMCLTTTFVFILVVVIVHCNAQQMAVASTSISNAASVTYTSGGAAQTISITLGLSETGGGGGSVTQIDVYFTDNADFKASGITKSAAVQKLFSTAIAVATGLTNDKTLLADQTVDLTIDAANCKAYTHVCVVITATGDMDDTDDFGCLSFGATVGTEAGTKDCKDVSVASTSITNAASATYTAGGSAQTITITLGLTDTGTGGTITKMDVYFTNNADFKASGIKKSTAVSKTFSPAIDVTAGSTDVKTFIADQTVDLTIDATNCADYTHVCVVITATGDIDDTNDCGCLTFGTTVGTGAGTKNCKGDSGASSVIGSVLTMFGASAVVMVTCII
ncbi:uncharacterized protein LOC144450250 [Glandiceps talaboti]